MTFRNEAFTIKIIKKRSKESIETLKLDLEDIGFSMS